MLDSVGSWITRARTWIGENPVIVVLGILVLLGVLLMPVPIESDDGYVSESDSVGKLSSVNETNSGLITSEIKVRQKIGIPSRSLGKPLHSFSGESVRSFDSERGVYYERSYLETANGESNTVEIWADDTGVYYRTTGDAYLLRIDRTIPGLARVGSGISLVSVEKTDGETVRLYREHVDSSESGYGQAMWAATDSEAYLFEKAVYVNNSDVPELEGVIGGSVDVVESEKRYSASFEQTRLKDAPSLVSDVYGYERVPLVYYWLGNEENIEGRVEWVQGTATVPNETPEWVLEIKEESERPSE